MKNFVMQISSEGTECPCRKVKCKRYLNCEVCRQSHRERKSLPACERR